MKKMGLAGLYQVVTRSQEWEEATRSVLRDFSVTASLNTIHDM